MVEGRIKLTAVVDRLENDQAVLKLSDGQTWRVDIEYLPEGVAEGAVINVFFGADTVATHNREAAAKALLNELLKGGSGSN